MNKRECEDAVSRQTVNELFNNEIKMYEERIETRKGSNYHDETERIKEFRSRIANAEYWQDKIKALPPVTPVQRWIPVSERLPKENTSYLVTVKQGYIMIAIWCGNPKYWRNVIAWMPLSKPYKSKMEGE